MTYQRRTVPWEMAPAAGYFPYEVSWYPTIRPTVPGRSLLAEC